MNTHKDTHNSTFCLIENAKRYFLPVGRKLFCTLPKLDRLESKTGMPLAGVLCRSMGKAMLDCGLKGADRVAVDGGPAGQHLQQCHLGVTIRRH